MALGLNIPTYGLNSLPRMGRRFAKERTKTAWGLETGRVNPWDLPEWRPTVEGYQGEYSRGLGDLARNFTRTGVTGPAAGLSMENMGNIYSGGLLNLPQQIRSDYSGEGWKGSQMGEGIRQYDKSWALQKLIADRQYALAKEAQEDPSFWDKYLNSIIGAGGSLTSMFGKSGMGMGTTGFSNSPEYLKFLMTYGGVGR